MNPDRQKKIGFAPSRNWPASCPAANFRVPNSSSSGPPADRRISRLQSLTPSHYWSPAACLFTFRPLEQWGSTTPLDEAALRCGGFGSTGGNAVEFGTSAAPAGSAASADGWGIGAPSWMLRRREF